MLIQINRPLTNYIHLTGPGANVALHFHIQQVHGQLAYGHVEAYAQIIYSNRGILLIQGFPYGSFVGV